MYKKGKLLYEGKTKRIWAVVGHPDLVIIENKNDITKNDDPSQTRVMSKKAMIATETTSLVFQALKEAGVPVAFIERISDTEFIAPKCVMIPLEVIERRGAVGSFLLRFNQFKMAHGNIPYRFDFPRFEIFLKTTSGIIRSKEGKEIGMLPIDDKTGRLIDDPFIYDPDEVPWRIKHPKMSVGDEKSNLCVVFPTDILPEGVSIKEIKKIADETFLVLEKLFESVGLKLIDFKIEFGIGPNGELLIADVIDNDSWRVRNHKWEELSKELFRQNVDMKKVEEAYEFILRELRRAVGLCKKR